MKRYLGLDIGGTSIKYGFVDESGTLEASGSVKTPGDYPSLLSACTAMGERMEDVSAIGVGVPGTCDVRRGSVVFSPNVPMLNGKDILYDLEGETHKPVYAENDANLAAYGEFYFSQKNRVNNMLFLSLGTGVGGGAIVNEQLLTGALTAAELGHITVNMAGHPCSCGKVGCLEEYCSIRGLQRFYKANGGERKTDPSDIYEKAMNGEAAAKKAFGEYATVLAHGMASLANIFSPEVIILGGGLTELRGAFWDETTRLFEAIVFPSFREKIKVEHARFGNRAGVMGAAALCMDREGSD